MGWVESVRSFRGRSGLGRGKTKSRSVIGFLWFGLAWLVRIENRQMITSGDSDRLEDC